MALVTANAAGAQQSSTQLSLGTLTCTIAPGVAVIVNSARDMRCMFYKSDGGKEAYRGVVRGGGLSVGITGRSVAAWAVTSTAALGRETSLSGRYSGVETGVTVGVGDTSRALLSANPGPTQDRAIPDGQVLSVPHPDARPKSTAMAETAPVEETKEPDPPY